MLFRTFSVVSAAFLRSTGGLSIWTGRTSVLVVVWNCLCYWANLPECHGPRWLTISRFNLRLKRIELNFKSVFTLAIYFKWFLHNGNCIFSEVIFCFIISCVVVSSYCYTQDRVYLYLPVNNCRYLWLKINKQTKQQLWQLPCMSVCEYFLVIAVLYLGGCKQRVCRLTALWVRWRVTAVWVDKSTWVETLQMSHTHTHTCLWGLNADYRELTRLLATVWVQRPQEKTSTQPF